MGQVENRRYADRNHDGIPAQGQKIRRNKISLVLALAIAMGSAACAGQDKSAAAEKLQFDKSKAWEHLVKQMSFGPRVPGKEGHIKCRDYMVAELKKSCDDVKTQQLTHKWSYTGETKTMWNVIGTQNWDKAKNRVLLIAHWDTRPFADQDPNQANWTKPIPGANDGASGVAVLIELARVMSKKDPELGIMYLMTDGEDLGPGLDEMFLGARYFAKNMPDKAPDYGILLDMIGDKDLKVPIEPNSQRYANRLVTKFYQFAAKNGYGKTFPVEQGPLIEDDHICLNDAGLPTMDLIDFDYEPWHTMNDTVDHCSAESLGQIGGMLQAWLEQKPAFSIRDRN